MEESYHLRENRRYGVIASRENALESTLRKRMGNCALTTHRQCRTRTCQKQTTYCEHELIQSHTNCRRRYFPNVTFGCDWSKSGVLQRTRRAGVRKASKQSERELHQQNRSKTGKNPPTNSSERYTEPLPGSAELPSSKSLCDRTCDPLWREKNSDALSLLASVCPASAVIFSFSYFVLHSDSSSILTC